MNIDTTDDDGGNTAGSVDHIEASGGVLNKLSPTMMWAGAPTGSVCQQEQSTIRVRCVALCVYMRDILPHMRCFLQLHPGKALHQTGR